MGRVIVRRLAWGIPTLWGVVTLVFLAIRVLPGDVALMIAGSGDAQVLDPAKVQRLREELGLTLPLQVQYLQWLWGALRFDLGMSLWTRQPVLQEIAFRLPYTLSLLVLSAVLSALLIIPVGVISAVKQDRWPDYALRIFTIVGLSVPNFWLALLVILFLVSVFRYFPPLDYAPVLKEPQVALQQLIFPALVLGYRHSAVCARMMRSCMLEVLREDYVRTARAKGLRESGVLLIHAMRNAMLPVITIFGLQLITLFGGVVIIERIFVIPGLGALLVDAVMRRDIPLVQGTVALTATFVLLINIVVDLSYSWFDPRIRYR